MHVLSVLECSFFLYHVTLLLRDGIANSAPQRCPFSLYVRVCKPVPDTLTLILLAHYCIL